MVAWKSTTEFSPESLDLAAYAAEHRFTFPEPGDDAAPTDPALVIDHAAWEALWDHARSADVEVGGLLIGEVFRDSTTDRLVTMVRGAIPALGGISSAVSFTFTPDAWDHLTTERDRSWPEMIAVGWFHTHPNLGVFYSGTDRNTQHAFFNRPWNVGIVLDPLALSDQVGLFVGAHSRRIPASDLVIAPEPVVVMRVPAEPIAEPTRSIQIPSRPSVRTVWDIYGSRVAAAAAGAAVAVVAVAATEWVRSQRREP